MRIALVTTSWPARQGDAAGHFVAAEARQLEGQGHRVVVVTPAPGGAFGWPGVAARLAERPWRALDAALWVASASRRLAGLDVDRVVAHWAVPCAWPVGIACQAELEVMSHGGDVRLLVALPGPVRARLARTLAARARGWRFVSAALLDELLSTLPAGARRAVERVARIEPAVLETLDVRGAVESLRRELEGARVAVSVGRLVASKRVDRAIEHVARTTELDALIVVGDGPERGRLERLARARGVRAGFVGRVSRQGALTWIGAAHVVLHASEREGLSTVVREAEQLGTPVLRLD